MNLPIQLDVTLPFEDVIQFCGLFVVMQLTIFLDVNEMHRCDRVLHVQESSTSESAGARRGLEIGEVGDLKIVCKILFLHLLVYAYGSCLKGELCISPVPVTG